MGFIDTFRTWLGLQRAAAPLALTQLRALEPEVVWASPEAKTDAGGLLRGMFPMGQPPKKGTRELMQAYGEMPWLRAASHCIAQAVAAVPMELYEVRGVTPGAKARLCREYAEGDARERAQMKRILQRAGELGRVERSHPMGRLLRGTSPTSGPGSPVVDGGMREMLDGGNLVLNGRQCAQISQVFQDLKGDGYAIKVRDADGVPVRYYPIPPHWVVQTPSTARPFFRVQHQSWYADLPESEVWWWKDVNPLNPYARGVGVAEALSDELQADESASKVIASWFDNGAVPQAFVTIKDAEKPELDAIEADFNNRHQGVFKRHLMYFTSGEIDIQELSQTFQEMEMVDLRKFLRDTVQQVFRIPPEILGIVENSNRATINASEYLFQKLVVAPRCEDWRERWQAAAAEWDDRIIVDFESPVPADKDFQLKVMTAFREDFTGNEVREFAGYEPSDDPKADQLHAPAAAPKPAATDPEPAPAKSTKK